MKIIVRIQILYWYFLANETYNFKTNYEYKKLTFIVFNFFMKFKIW